MRKIIQLFVTALVITVFSSISYGKEVRASSDMIANDFGGAVWGITPEPSKIPLFSKSMQTKDTSKVKKQSRRGPASIKKEIPAVLDYSEAAWGIEYK